MATETPREKLERIGKTQLITDVSSRGKVAPQAANYATQEAYQGALYQVLGEVPEDPNGLGYDFSSVETPEE